MPFVVADAVTALVLVLVLLGHGRSGTATLISRCHAEQRTKRATICSITIVIIPSAPNPDAR